MRHRAGLGSCIALTLVALAAGCSGWPSASPRVATSALRPLDDSHAADFRQVFDEARERPRYLVALSPT